MKATLLRTEFVAHNIQTFWMEPEQPTSYIAGQFIEMTLPHDQPDERGIKHWFTLSSSPTEPALAITTRQAEHHSSTFKQTLFGLKPGAQLTISEPMGDFVLPKDTTIPLIFVAGGIGITPMRSMVKWLSDRHEKRSLHIIYGAKKLEDIAFRDLFESYNAKLEIVLSDQTSDWSGRKGHLGVELIQKITGPLSNHLVYISGPEPMVESLEKDFGESSFPHEQLVLDFFPGYQPI